MNSKSAIPLVLAALALSQCSPYSGTSKLTKTEAIGYGSQFHAEPPKSTGRPSFGAAPVAMAATYLIGYIFNEVGDRITKARTGSYGPKGAHLTNTDQFPKGGYFVIIRTIRDEENKFPNLASVNDFIKGTKGTAGGNLKYEILQSAEDGGSLTGTSLTKTVFSSVGGKYDNTDKLALLAVCPILKLDEKSGSMGLYGIGLTGIYFPVLKASRFGLESSSLSKRITSSKESMTLEIHGPNGTGYTTGVAKVPLVWNPPQKGSESEWMDSKLIFSHLTDKDQKDQIKELISQDAMFRLSKQQAFVAPSPATRRYLFADVGVSETSEATGWLVKEVKALEKKANGLVPSR